MDNATLLPLDQIVPNPDQPRKVRGNPSPTLMASIRRFGVLQPIVVRPLEDGRYMIVSGERRYRAALALGIKAIPAVVREMDDSTAFEAAIAENAVRQNLDPLENVEILVGRLRQRGLDEEGMLEVMRRARSQIRRNRFGPETQLLMEIASPLGVSVSTVALAYRHLFKLPEWLRKSLKGYHIPLEDLNRVAENPALIEQLKAQKEAYEKNPPRLPGRLAQLGPEDHLRIYKKEGVWGSYKAPHFNGGIHGLPHVRLRRKRIRSAAIMRSRAGEGRGQGREDQKGPPRDEGTQKRAEACRLSA